MRAFITALFLGASLSLAACADSAEQNAIDEGAPAGDQEDVVGDGEVIDEPGEPEGNALTTDPMTTDSMGAGTMGADTTMAE